MNQVAHIDPSSASTIEAGTEKTTSESGQLFIARQPIFDRHSNVFAYELLYRSGMHNAALVTNGNVASSQVILNAFVSMGIQSIAEDKPVFVNLTRDFIVGKLPLPLSPDKLVVEILEDIEVDAALVNSIGELSNQGYTIALDDYVFTEDKAPLFEKIDIIKIDLPECNLENFAPELEKFKQQGIKLLAEKVETHEEYELCKSLGFDYFQGYFFSKPKIISRQTLKSNRLAVLQVLAMLQDPNCNINSLEALISRDVAISYKLLRIINSALYNLPNKIESVKQAIVSLGLKTIREWMTIVILTDVDDKPRELISLSLQRARMMHLLAEAKGLNPETGFITGLFSLLDAFMDRPMTEVVQDLPLANEIVDALIDREGELGNLLELIILYEQGDWNSLPSKGDMAENLQASYVDSIAWCHQLFEQISGTT